MHCQSGTSMNAYLQPDLKSEFAHFAVRISILKAVRSFLPLLHGTVVDLGSGNMPYKPLVVSQPLVKRYLAVDWRQTSIYHTVPDIYWDGKTLPMESNSVDCIMMTEVLEHLSQPVAVLKEVHRVLKPAGLLMGTTPFVWPLHEVPNDRQRFTPLGVADLLAQADFVSAEVTGGGGWRTALAQFLSAYVSFGMQNRLGKKIGKALLYLPVKWLVSHDKPVTEFLHTGMVNITVFKAAKPA